MEESEKATRKTRIDARLRSAGWTIVPWADGLDLTALSGHAVEELPTANGPADYALFVDGRLIGFIEAKKVTVNPQNVLQQARRYAEGAFQGVGDWAGLRVPFLYSTNGELIWHLDARPAKRVSRQLAAFHTPIALGERFDRDTVAPFAWLLDTPPERIAGLRPYQHRAILATEESIRADRREMLVAMATGTGKTFVTVSQIYRLLESKLIRRVLFLVDRKALAAQAVRTFNAFQTPHGNKFTQEYEVYSQRFQREDFGDDEPFDPKVLPNEYLTHPKSSQTFVYVSTIQRLAGQVLGPQFAFAQSRDDAEREDELDLLPIPIHAFDLIVADECHRGYTAQEESVWRDTLNHFDAIKVGLTATPATHTVTLFGSPIFRYGVEQAILDGWLVDHEPVSIHSEVRMKATLLRRV
jgi:type I restriction enzyme, R subunit